MLGGNYIPLGSDVGVGVGVGMGVGGGGDWQCPRRRRGVENELRIAEVE